MKLSSLEKSRKELEDTVFAEYGDIVKVVVGLNCLVVVIADGQWKGPTPSFINNIPITYLFGIRHGVLPS